MAIDIRTVSALGAVNGTSCAATMPGSHQAGDFVIIWANSVASGGTIFINATSWPGWTSETQVNESGNRLHSRVFHKFLTTNPASNPAVQQSNSQLLMTVTMAFTGVRTAGPLCGSMANLTATSSTMYAPPVSIREGYGTLVRLFASRDDNYHHPGASNSGQLLFSYTTTTGSDGSVSGMFFGTSKGILESATIGTATMLQSANASDPWVGYTISLRAQPIEQNSKNAIDKLFLDEDRLGDLQKGIREQPLFLYDVGARGREASASGLDKMFLFDARRSAREGAQRDSLFTRDALPRDLAKLVREAVYTQDPATARRFTDIHAINAPLPIADVSRLSIEKRVQDALPMLSQRGQTVLARLIRDHLMLGWSATPEYTPGGGGEGQIYEPSIPADGLYMSEGVKRAVEKALRDPVMIAVITRLVMGHTLRATDYLLLNGTLGKIVEKVVRDSGLIGERFVKGLERLLTDKMFVSDGSSQTKGKEVIASDGFFLKDLRRGDLLKRITEPLLVIDPAGYRDDEVIISNKPLLLGDNAEALINALGEFLIYLSDGLMLDDRVGFGSIDRKVVDSLLVASSVRRAIESAMRDGLLMYDEVAEISKGLELVIRDGLFLLSVAARAREVEAQRQFVDKMLLSDAPVRDLVKEMGDKLMLGDRAVLDGGRLIAIMDGLFVSDDQYSDLAKKLRDAIFTADARTSDLMKLVIDKLLLGSEGATLREGKGLLNISDGLMITDRQVLDAHKRMREALFLQDGYARELLKYLLDKMMLGSSGRWEIGLKEVIRLDGLFTPDRSILQMQKLVRESLLLNEQTAVASKLTSRELLEKLFLRDYRTTTRDTYHLDQQFVSDVSRLIMETLLRDNLVVGDRVAAQWYPVLIEFLTYARLRVVQLLGVSTRAIDFLGRRLYAIDLFGRRIAAMRWRLG